MPFDATPEVEVVVDPVVQRLELALRRLQRNWIKGRYYNPSSGGVCLVGATQSFLPKIGVEFDNCSTRAQDNLQIALRNHHGNTYSLVSYNDAFERRKKDILFLVREAIVLAKQLS